MALLRTPHLPLMSSSLNAPSDPTSAPPPTTLSTLTSARSRRQLSLFLAGASFFALSTIITRRSLVRRRQSIIPSFYRPSNLPPIQPVNGALEAFEALNIATINVSSFMMMTVGGALWAFDISTLEELRRKVRGGLGVDGMGRGQGDVEEEWEEWLAGVVERRREKERRRRERGGENRSPKSTGVRPGAGGEDAREWQDDVDVSGEDRFNERGERR